MKFRAKPDRDPTEATFRAIMRTSRMVWQIMEPFFESHGISLSQWVVLRHLLMAEEGGDPAMPLRQLNKRLMVRQPTLTAVVNKLEHHGLVRRVASPHDRRERMLGLTPKGRALLGNVLDGHRRRIHSLLDVWSAEEKVLVLGLFERLGTSLEQHEQFAFDSRAQRTQARKR